MLGFAELNPTYGFRVRKLGAAVCLLLLGLAAPAAAETAPEPGATNAALSHEFCGTFRWQGEAGVQDVFVKLADIEAGADGRIAASGKGRYVTSGQTTYIDVKWLIDRQSRRFEMWELNPSQPGFTTDGSHVGSITGDLAAIDATWTTNGTGAHGTLTLRACATAVSFRLGSYDFKRS
jgi:hypothetical protein